MTPQRPALAEVLAALDAPTADGLTVGDGPAMSPVEAVEALATARLWPWEPGDDPTRWWCDACVGSTAESVTLSSGSMTWIECRACRPSRRSDAIGYTDNPPTLAALLAVASLGAPSLVTAVELAGVLAPGAVVVWRATTREALRSWTEERVYRDGDASLAYVVAHEHLGAPSASPLRYGNPAAWPESFPWLGLHGMHVARQSWSEVRALGMMGAPPLSIDSSRIVLAVEAIGGDRG